MSEFLPAELQLASHDDISEVVGVVVRKLGSISTHAEMPRSPVDIPEEVIKSMLRKMARQTGLTVDQILNAPHHPLVELIPVEDLDRLAIIHFGYEAGMPPSRYVAAVIRESRGDKPAHSAHIMETRSGRLRMIMDATVLRAVVTDEPVETDPDAIREATVADCIKITRQITTSPDSRY